jgi:hypothetical protein
MILAVAVLPLYGCKSEACALHDLIAFEVLWPGVEPDEG